MRLRLASGAALAWLALGAGLPALAEVPAGLAGTWQGRIVLADGAVTGDEVRLELEPSREGFSIAWRLPSGHEGSAEFAAAASPGVFKPVSGGMFSMFGSEAAGDPLEGGQLLWARAEKARLVVYTLSIASTGAYVVDRLDCARTESGVELNFSRRQNGVGDEAIRAELVEGAGR